MATTVLSSKGQVIIPKPIRTARHLEPGQRLEVIETDEGILLKPSRPFAETALADVASCLEYHGKAKTLSEMEEAIHAGAKETARDRD